MDKGRLEVSETNFLKMWQVYRPDGVNDMAQQLSALHINPLTPNDHYSGRTAPLTSIVAFYIFIKQI